VYSDVVPIDLRAAFRILHAEDEQSPGAQSMPVYEYYCPPCNETFMKLRPMSASAEPYEHDCGTVAQKVLTSAVVSIAGKYAEIEAAEAMPAGGGCACGRGSCGCGGGGMDALN
jgi:putative FmdB family regulatory protein